MKAGTRRTRPWLGDATVRRDYGLLIIDHDEFDRIVRRGHTAWRAAGRPEEPEDEPPAEVDHRRAATL